MKHYQSLDDKRPRAGQVAPLDVRVDLAKLIAKLIQRRNVLLHIIASRKIVVPNCVVVTEECDPEHAIVESVTQKYTDLFVLRIVVVKS